VARACTRISATLAACLRDAVSARGIRPLNAHSRVRRVAVDVNPLAEQRALVTQPDEDSKAVRFRRHTIWNIRMVHDSCSMHRDIHQIASLTKRSQGALQGLGCNAAGRALKKQRKTDGRQWRNCD
jgi:hypothetical protein